MLAALLVCPCFACPAADSSPVATSTEAQSDPEPPGKPAPAPVVAAPWTPQPLPDVEPLGEPKDCPPLAALPADAPESQRELVPLAEALRSIACTPAVFAQTTAEARKTLALPEALPLELGRRYAAIAVGDSPVRVADLLAALGITDAKMRFELDFVGRWVIELGQWGSGVVTISIATDRHDETPDGTIAEIPADAAIADHVTVVMPEAALSFAADPHAAPLLATVLTKLAEQPALLANDPEQLLTELAQGDERFELHRYSEGLGETQRVGLSIRPRRTELVAADLVRAFGLTDVAHERIRIYDANPDRLARAGETPFVWKGLQLQIELRERDEGLGLGLSGWLIDDMQILPAP